MTNEELKQEAIKKDYGGWYKRCNPDENGYSEIYNDFYEELEENREVQYLNYEMSNKWRPKSLSGIENNLGWTRIEEDGSNLPKEDCGYKVGKFLEDGSFHIGYDDITLDDFKEYVEDFNYTHYQPIIKPEPPIY